MEAARQEFRQKMTQYNLALAKMAGVAERLKSQVKTKAVRAQDLERRVLANHSAGNIELAGMLARELQELKVDLDVDTQELSETEEAYQANLRQAKVAQQEFQDKIGRLEKQLSQVKIKEAQAEAATALSSVAFKVGDLGDTMRPSKRCCRSGTKCLPARRAWRATWSTWHAVQEKESERKALEQAALAEFLASQGMQATPTTDQRRRPSRKWVLRNERAEAGRHCPRQASSPIVLVAGLVALGVYMMMGRGGYRFVPPTGRPRRRRRATAARKWPRYRSRCLGSRRPAPCSSPTTSSRSRSASTPAMPV